MKILILCSILLSSEPLQFMTYTPNHVKPEIIEAVVNRTIPNAGVSAVPRQNSVIVSGNFTVLEAASVLIKELDKPNQTVELEISMSDMNNAVDSSYGLGATITRANAKREIPQVPTTLRQVGGTTRSSFRQTIVAMQGYPAEIFVGETQLRDFGPLNPPVEVQAGKKIKIEGLTIVNNGQGCQMDISVENTIPGSGPIVSSGTRVKTALSLDLGETKFVSTNDGNDKNDGSLFDNNYDKSGGYSLGQKNRRKSNKNGQISVTLKKIR